MVWKALYFDNNVKNKNKSIYLSKNGYIFGEYVLKKTLGKRVEIFNKREYNENALHKKLRKN